MSEAQVLVRLLIAALCGAAIGTERERGDRPAGLKTYVLISLGACLFSLLSLRQFPQDPARVAAQVVIGVGFLGAGVIVVYGGTHIVGITTAASVWATAAVGMAAGFGYLLTSLYVTALILFFLFLLPVVESGLIEKVRRRRLYLMLEASHREGILNNVKEALTKEGVRGMNVLRYSHCASDETCSILLRVNLPAGISLDHLAESLHKVEGVATVRFEE
ncbi:MAG: MgtC/SapB family protein [Candidatus Hadarchaeum sp.]